MWENLKNHYNSKKISLITLLLLTFFLIVFNLVEIPKAEEKDRVIKFPTKPIKIIVPASAGGSLGAEIRSIVPFLERNLGVSIFVEFIGSAEGIVAYNKLYKAKPDGYTILHCTYASAIALELTRESAKFKIKDLFPIAGWTIKNEALVVNPDNWKTLSEFLDDAKKKNISVAGTGGSPEFQGRLLESATGVKFNWVPYESGGEASAAVAGKHIDAVVSYTISQKSMIRAGKLRALTIFSERPDPVLPEVPTIYQLGYHQVPLFLNSGTFFAPPNTPKEIVNILEEAISKATADPGFLKLAGNSGVVPDFKPSSVTNKLILECFELLNKYKQFIK